MSIHSKKGDLSNWEETSSSQRRRSSSRQQVPRSADTDDDDDDEDNVDMTFKIQQQQQQQQQPFNDYLSDDHANNINTTIMTGLSLRQVAAQACKSIDIGAAVLPKPLFTPDVEDYNGSEELRDAASSVETHYARVLQKEFNAIVIEHHLKWAPLLLMESNEMTTTTSNTTSTPTTANPNTNTATTTTAATAVSMGTGSSHGNTTPATTTTAANARRVWLSRYDFHHADAVVDWAVARGIKVKGHVLVWHVTSPKCCEDMEPQELRQCLRQHIFTIMGHFRGRIQLWDVVNEALAPDGSLAENVFYRKLGPEYIADAFYWAHEADPTAVLLYNDNKVEGIGTKKAEGFYQLLADLKAKNVPVHGCGMQAHFNAAGTGVNRPPTPRMVKEQIHRLGKLGLTVNLSEMDVRVSKLPLAERQRQIAQRQIYHDIIAAALSEPAFDGIWLWGFTDRHTWVSSFYYDDEPLIFDENYNRKEAYYGLRDALATLSPGGVVGGQGVLLDSDFDLQGNPWGHLWMQPEPEGGEVSVSGPTAGDSRPDWEQNEEKALDSEDDEDEIENRLAGLRDLEEDDDDDDEDLFPDRVEDDGADGDAEEDEEDDDDDEEDDLNDQSVPDLLAEPSEPSKTPDLPPIS